MPARINHLSVARKYLDKANKLSQFLQAKGLPKSHTDFAKLKRFRQRAEIHMMQHKDVSEGNLAPGYRNPYLAVEDAKEQQDQNVKDAEKKKDKKKVSGFKEFSNKKKDEDDEGGDDTGEKVGAINDDGEDIVKLSGKRDKVTINPQMRTIQNNIGGQSK